MRHRRQVMIFSFLFGGAALLGALTPPKSPLQVDPLTVPPSPDVSETLKNEQSDLDQLLREKQEQEKKILSLQEQLDARADEVRELEEHLKLLEVKKEKKENLEESSLEQPKTLGGQQQPVITETVTNTEIAPPVTSVDFAIEPSYFQNQDLDFSSPYTPEGVYLYERVVGGRGRGFVSEAQALNAFFAFPVSTSGDYVFADLTGRRLTGNHRYGGSYGMGCRSSYFSDTEMVGINLFYDHANFLNNDFQQIGVGAELISPNWEVYLNGYFPIGNKVALEDSCIYTYPEDGFRLLIEEQQVSMWGMDIEFGRSLVLPYDRNRNWSFYLGAGPYFYRASHKTCCDQSLIGGQGRLNVSVGDGANLDLFVTYDNVYKTRAMLSLTIAFPFGGVDPRPLPVRRNPIPMTKHSCKYTSLGIPE